jgi:hypothetical protein
METGATGLEPSYSERDSETADGGAGAEPRSDDAATLSHSRTAPAEQTRPAHRLTTRRPARRLRTRQIGDVNGVHIDARLAHCFLQLGPRAASFDSNVWLTTTSFGFSIERSTQCVDDTRILDGHPHDGTVSLSRPNPWRATSSGPINRSALWLIRWSAQKRRREDRPCSPDDVFPSKSGFTARSRLPWSGVIRAEEPY